MTPANRMPVVGCHAKARQRMMEIKGTARIRGAEGERGEPHVSKRRRRKNFQMVKSLPTSPRKQLSMRTFYLPQYLSTASSPLSSSSLYFITNIFPGNTEWRCLFYLPYEKPLVLELSHPAVPVASELIRQQLRTPATKYVLKRPHEYLKWIVEQHEEKGREAVSGMMGGWENKSAPQYTF